LIILNGKNGSGKCVSKDTLVEIQIDDKNIKKRFKKFIKNRKIPLLPINKYNKKCIMNLKNDIFFKDFNINYLNSIKNKFNSKNSLKKFLNNNIRNVCKEKGTNKLNRYDIKFWIVRGWTEEESKIKILLPKTKRRKSLIKRISCFTPQFWIRKGFSEEEAKRKVSEIQSKNSKKFQEKKKTNPEKYKQILSPMTKEFWIKKGFTSEEEINFKIKSQRKLNIEYWIYRGASEPEAIEKVSEYQRENSNKALKWAKENPEEYKNSNTSNINYYLNKGHSLEESKLLLKERQTTFTLEKCIKKHGEEKGKEIYETRQKKWVKKMFNPDTCMSSGRSMMADKIVENILEKIDDEKKLNILYGKDEKFIYSKKEKRCYKYDLCLGKKIIEINGDFWHSNPKIYKSDDIHRIHKIKCSEIWKRDEIKIENAIEHGYDVLVIWESESVSDLEGTIKKCIDFLR